MAPEGGLLSVAEVAVGLRLKKQKVCELFHDGRFPGAFQLGGTGSAIRIPEDGLEKFVRSRCKGGQNVEPVMSGIMTTIRRIRGG